MHGSWPASQSSISWVFVALLGLTQAHTPCPAPARMRLMREAVSAHGSCGKDMTKYTMYETKALLMQIMDFITQPKGGVAAVSGTGQLEIGVAHEAPSVTHPKEKIRLLCPAWVSLRLVQPVGRPQLIVPPARSMGLPLGCGYDRGSIVLPARSMGLPLGRGRELSWAHQVNAMRGSEACTAPFRSYA